MPNLPDILARRQQQQQFRSPSTYGQPTARVDRERGIIFGVQIVREGEAKSHGVQVDSDFVAKIATFGNAAKQGIKSRFNHPNMSAGALGTMLGTFRNFSINGTAAYADLHLSEAARTAPQGDLHTYVLDLAEKEPEHFGNSIAFSDDGKLYVKNQEGEKRELSFQQTGFMEHEIKVREGEELVDYDTDIYTEELYVIPTTLHASDLVDDPAATDGLFSNRFNSNAFAVQLTTFLDAHPDIWGFVEKHPDKLYPFFEKYRVYQQRRALQSIPKMSKKKPNFFQRLLSAFRSGGTFDISVTDTEGNQLSVVTENEEPQVGDKIYVLGEGDPTPAPDGNYVVASGAFEGQTITVAKGQIADITEPEEGPTEQPTDEGPQDTSMSSGEMWKEIKRLGSQLSHLQQENARLKKKPAAAHTNIGQEDFTQGQQNKKASFNEEGRKAWERGKRSREPKPENQNR